MTNHIHVFLDSEVHMAGLLKFCSHLGLICLVPEVRLQKKTAKRSMVITHYISIYRLWHKMPYFKSAIFILSAVKRKMNRALVS